MKFACEDRKNYIRGDLELTCEPSHHHLEYTCDAIWRGKQSFNSAIVSHNRLICTEVVRKFRIWDWKSVWFVTFRRSYHTYRDWYCNIDDANRYMEWSFM